MVDPKKPHGANKKIDSKEPSQEEGSHESESQPRLADALRRILTGGVTAAFMTEEGVRSYLGDLKMPKEILHALLQSAGKTKDEIALRVSNEMIHILRKIDFVQELSKFAEDHSFKISAEIEIVKKKKNSEEK